jgi:hypothetical protein
MARGENRPEQKSRAADDPAFTLLSNSIYFGISLRGMENGVGRKVLPVVSSIIT